MGSIFFKEIKRFAGYLYILLFVSKLFNNFTYIHNYAEYMSEIFSNNLIKEILLKRKIAMDFLRRLYLV